MAEEQQGAAQNKLGQLYVELGAKGLGNLTKGLNGLSAQFLLTKNAAQQAIKPIVDMSQKSVSQIVNYDKLHSIMGIAIKDLQDYKIAAQLIGVSPDLVFSQMKNVQQQILRIRAGFDSNGVQGLSILDIDPRSLDANDPMKVITETGKKLKTVDEGTRATVLGLLGWSEELAYFFDRVAAAQDSQNTKFLETLKLNDKELGSLREQQDAWNLLSTTWQQAQQKFIANQGWIVKSLNETAKIIKDIGNYTNDGEGATSGLMQWISDKKARADFKKYSQKLEKGKALTQQEFTEYELAKAYLNGDKGIYKKYNLQARQTHDFFKQEKEKNKIKDSVTIDNAIDKLNAEQLQRYLQLQNENTKNQITNITGATPLNEQAKAAGLPPLPKAEPSKPMQYLPSNTTRDVQYTVIQDINQYIQGNDSQQIANDVSNRLLQDATNTSIYNPNLPNI